MCSDFNTQPTFVYLACSFQVKMNHNIIDCLIAEFFINKMFLFEVVKFSGTSGCLLAKSCRPRKRKLAMYTVSEREAVWPSGLSIGMQSESPKFKLLPNP